MRLRKLLRSFGSPFLGSGASSADAAAHTATSFQLLRKEMEDLALDAGCDSEEYLCSAIRCSTEVGDLWYLRAELLVRIARAKGEQPAREQIECLMPHFNKVGFTTRQHTS